MVTAVLIQWKRQHNLPRIIEEICKVSEINEILVHDNSKGENLACYRRFELAVKARNEIIYTQDDDCINHDIPKLFGNKRTTCGATQGYMDALSKPPYSNTSLGLLGYGSVIHKNDIDFSKYLERYPIDDLFYREADRIFTLLGKRPIIIPCKIELIDEDIDPMSNQPNHLPDREEIINRCQKLA